jgi:para-nitrobenzyl esterase
MAQMPMDELHQLVSQEFDERSKRIIDAYRRDYPQATRFALYGTIALASFRRLACEQAIRKAAFRRAPAYAYLYAWRTPVLDGRSGRFHAAGLAFTFDNAELCDHYSGGTPEAFVLSKQISTAWVSLHGPAILITTDLPPWPKYTSERRAMMQFDSTCAERDDPEGQGLRLIAAA